MHPKNRIHAFKCFRAALLEFSTAVFAISRSSLFLSIACILQTFLEKSRHQKIEYDLNEHSMQGNRDNLTRSHANHRAPCFFSCHATALNLSLPHSRGFNCLLAGRELAGSNIVADTSLQLDLSCQRAVFREKMLFRNEAAPVLSSFAFRWQQSEIYLAYRCGAPQFC